MKNRKAFTLIELLVVIAVLAAFMALLVPNFMQVRIKSRDMRRKTDLKAIQKALELYKQGQSTPIYPASLTSCATITDANGVIYLKEVPQDPLAKCPVISSAYKYVPAGNLFTYTLTACLENSNDSEKATTCPGGFTCTTACYQLTEP